MIFHDISNSSCRSFKSHICLLNSVAVLRLLFLKDCLCRRLLKLPFVSPTYFFSSEFDFMMASYIIPSSRHFPSTGHVSFFLQLHDLFSSPSVSSLSSWLLMALSMLGMHRGDTFTFSVFLLNIFLSWWSMVKCLSTSRRNFLEIFVSILWQKGGLNQVILRFLFLRCVGPPLP